MTIVRRRHFLKSLAAFSLPLLIPLTQTSHSFARTAGRVLIDGNDCAHGCIFARRPAAALTRTNQSAASHTSIDFWTFRVSEIESQYLPREVSQIIVWDDVFSHPDLANQVSRVLQVFPEYYGFDPSYYENNFEFHLEGISDIGVKISKLLQPATSSSPFRRVALINIASCGISRLGWADIIPYLKAHYDLIICFAHFPGQGPRDLHAVFGVDEYQPGHLSDLTNCNFSFLTSDGLLGFADVLDSESRYQPLNDLFQSLVRGLSSSDLSNATAITDGARCFAVGALPVRSPNGNHSSEAIERQRHILSREFGAPHCDNPTLLTGISQGECYVLWPLDSPIAT